MISFSLKTTILMVVSAACFSSAIISPCLPFIAQYFHITNEIVSSLVSIFLFGYLAGQIFHSVISQSYGYKNSLRLGFLIFIVSSFVQILAVTHNSFNIFYFSRFFCAFGAASGLICAFAMIKDYSLNLNESHKIIALAFTSLTLFAYLSITLGGLIVQYFNWISVLYITLSVAIFEFFLICKFIPNSKIKKSKYSYKVTLTLVNHLKSFFNFRLLFPSLAVAFTTTCTYLYSAFASSIAVSFFEIPISTFGLISIFNLIALLSGSWLCSFLSKRAQQENILLGSIVFTMIPISALFIYHDTIFDSNSEGVFFFTLTALLNLGLGLIYPTASYMALNSLEPASIASSTMNFLKISIPAVTISLISQFNLGLISGYKYPLAILCAAALFSCTMIRFNYLSKIS